VAKVAEVEWEREGPSDTVVRFLMDDSLLLWSRGLKGRPLLIRTADYSPAYVTAAVFF
jgi:hypothetical protein